MPIRWQSAVNDSFKDSNPRPLAISPFMVQCCGTRRHDARPTAPPPAHRPVLSVPEHYGAPLNHHLDAANGTDPIGGQNVFMCINRWCSEKPKKTTPKLTAFLTVDQAEIRTFCSDHDSKQTQRGFGIVAGVIQ